MCFKYKCIDCKSNKRMCCTHYNGNTEKCEIYGAELPVGMAGIKCYTCTTIKGAIVELQILLYREPWLGTDGAGGAPKKESWEVDDNNNNKENEDYDSGGEDADGYSWEERRKVRMEAERAVALRWGLLKAEQEAEEGTEGTSSSG